MPKTTDTTKPMELCNIPPPVDPATNASPPPWAILSVDPTTPRSQIDGFLDQFRPSQWTRNQVAWISVVRKDYDVPRGDPETMAQEWQWLCERGETNMAELDRLARKYNVLSGKWMVVCPTLQVDQVWQRIAVALAMDGFGPSAKVSPVEHGGDHVICIYVANYLDHVAVQRVREALRQLGHTKKLLFKPDVFTYCGIYKNNQWGIPTYIFKQ